jgi:hypothetical protein
MLGMELTVSPKFHDAGVPVVVGGEAVPMQEGPNVPKGLSGGVQISRGHGGMEGGGGRRPLHVSGGCFPIGFNDCLTNVHPEMSGWPQ